MSKIIRNTKNRNGFDSLQDSIWIFKKFRRYRTLIISAFNSVDEKIANTYWFLTKQITSILNNYWGLSNEYVLIVKKAFESVTALIYIKQFLLIWNCRKNVEFSIYVYDYGLKNYCTWSMILIATILYNNIKFFFSFWYKKGNQN